MSFIKDFIVILDEFTNYLEKCKKETKKINEVYAFKMSDAVRRSVKTGETPEGCIIIDDTINTNESKGIYDYVIRTKKGLYTISDGQIIGSAVYK
ncbi:MAG: hypothetical protein PHX99_07275 [Synergistaceae bacterium]|nr:hypothetical protein [Synergistaceae bacterium]